MASEVLFVTGTDTGVGKTLCSAALLHALRRRHARVVGMKPVAAGLVEHEGRLVSEDVLALRAASSVAVPPELDNPVALPELSTHSPLMNSCGLRASAFFTAVEYSGCVRLMVVTSFM